MTPLVQRRATGAGRSVTSDRLVSAARDCLRRDGVAGASSRAITAAAGANLGAITYYYGSKERLVAVALAEELREWTTPALEALDSPGDAAMRLFDAVSHLNTAFDAARDRAPALLDVFVHAGRHTIDSPVATIWGELHARVRRVVTELRDQGVVPSWVTPDAMAALILAVGAGTVVTATVEPSTDHRAIGAQFAALLLSASASPR